MKFQKVGGRTDGQSFVRLRRLLKTVRKGSIETLLKIKEDCQVVFESGNWRGKKEN